MATVGAQMSGLAEFTQEGLTCMALLALVLPDCESQCCLDSVRLEVKLVIRRTGTRLLLVDPKM